MQIRHLAATACLAGVCVHANAVPPLTLRYSVSDLGDGTHRYSFVLTIDDPDQTWTPGDGFGWIVFGDRLNGDGAFEDWIADPGSLIGGPWYYCTNTSGYNNGATLGAGRTLWIPTRKGESILWSGVTHAQLSPGELCWSCLLASYVHPVGKALGPIADFEPAVLACPADFDNDGFLTGEDFDAYLAAFQLGDLRADYDRDGFLTGADFDGYSMAFETGC